MHRWILLLLFLPSCLLAQGIDDTEWAQMAYEKGAQYKKDHDWSNALRFYEEAISRRRFTGSASSLRSERIPLRHCATGRTPYHCRWRNLRWHDTIWNRERIPRR